MGSGGSERVFMLVRKPLLWNARVYKQALSLTRAGYEVVVVGMLSPGAPRRELRDGFTIVRVGRRPSSGRPGRGPISERPDRLNRISRVLRRFSFPLVWLDFYVRCDRLVRSKLRPGDVVHCNDLDTLPVGVFLARSAGVPLVYDAQDLYADQDHIPGWLRRLLIVAERALVRHVDRIIAVNGPIGEVMAARYGVHIDAVVLNCPPAARNGGAAARPTVRAALDVPDGRRVLVYSGALSANRGLENTIEALRHLDDVQLVLLGEGVLRDHLEMVARRAGLSDRVTFTGFIPYLDVPAFISSADVGIVPYERVGLNHYLCSPNKLFHYLMAGLPIACSDFPFLRTIVLDNDVGAVFDPSDPRSIATAIRELISDPTVAEARRARLEALKVRYSWEEEEKRFLAVYESLPAARSRQLNGSAISA